MSLEIKKSALWEANRKAMTEAKYICNQGGTASGKTFAIMDLLMFICCTEKNKTITVTAPNWPCLQRGAVRDAQTIWNSDDMYKKMLSEPTQNGMKCSTTGSIIEFGVFYNTMVARGAKRDYLFINEANAFDYSVAWELFARTRKNVFLDWNPNARCWIHEKFESDENAKWIYSTHKANHWLPQSMHDEIESLREKDPERYLVYGLGCVGRTEGCVYENWSQVSELPDECKWVAFGLDFGFTQDPTTLIEVRYSDGQLWVKEHIYNTGMTNQDIADKIKELGFKGEFIICDSAEKKSIEELRRFGIMNARAAVKGPGSINAGIDIVKSMKLNVHRDSNNIKSELLNYKWDTDTLGHFSNKPIDKFNHALDALRYCVMWKFTKPKANTFVGGW